MVEATAKAKTFASGVVPASNANETSTKNLDSSKNDSSKKQVFDLDDSNRNEMRSISGQKVLTVAEEGEKILADNLKNIKSGGLKGVAIAGGLASVAAFVFEFLPDSRLKTFVENNIKRIIAGVFGAFGTIGAIDAVNRKDHKQTAAQLASIAIPNFLVPKDQFDDLTLYRGVDVGLMNFAAEADKLPGGKKNYASAGESFGHVFTAMETLFRELRKDPIKAITDFRSGVGTLFWSGLTMLSPIVYKVTGARFPSYLMRHAGGLIAEFGKLSPANLTKGAYKYFASGLFLFASSLINLIGSGAGDRTKKLTEYITWALNIFGKELQLSAISSGETSKDFRAKAVEMSELPDLIMKHFMGKNGYQKAESSADSNQKTEISNLNEDGSSAETTVYLGKSDTIVSNPRTSAYTRSYFRPMSRTGSSSGGSGVSRIPATSKSSGGSAKKASATKPSKAKSSRAPSPSPSRTKSSSSSRRVGGRFSSSKK